MKKKKKIPCHHQSFPHQPLLVAVLAIASRPLPLRLASPSPSSPNLDPPSPSHKRPPPQREAPLAVSALSPASVGALSSPSQLRLHLSHSSPFFFFYPLLEPSSSLQLLPPPDRMATITGFFPLQPSSIEKNPIAPNTVAASPLSFPRPPPRCFSPLPSLEIPLCPHCLVSPSSPPTSSSPSTSALPIGVAPSSSPSRTPPSAAIISGEASHYRCLSWSSTVFPPLGP